MTPRELTLHVEAYNERRQIEREDIIRQAYYTAAWQRGKKMPKLEKVLESIRPKQEQRPQTPEEMLAVAMRLHSENGGEIV
ncbi:hypothetical protein [Paenibacillus ginsengarvi]|uniref:hypothetical protein n=1 Tax=Paenibacillus ginsengarvi TaxID=400777 RepID=UPI0011C3773F|nr:hypothetical protein [Paenibacillus ginsengarvi]